jgi:hypothetical protein
MFRRLIKALFSTPVSRGKKCAECGGMKDIRNLDGSGTCKSCAEWRQLLDESDEIKRARGILPARPEPMRTEPAPMLDRIRDREELEREMYAGQG